MNPFESIESPENTESIESPENSLEVPLSFVEKHENKTPEILGNFFSKLNFQNYTILEINTTRKSIYGSVEIENKKLFYKISKAESILQELQGYKIASEYPHEEVIKHHFEDDYGVLLQTFSLNMDKPETLLAGTINKSLLIKNDKEIDSILAQTEQIFSTMGDLYLDGLTKSPLTLNGPNDIFFNNRLQPGGRLDQHYAHRKFNLDAQGKDLLFEDILKYSLTVNQGNQTPKLGELLQQAKTDLSPNHPRYFVLSQGDPTESNITATGTFFDFETAGYNSLVQEIAIFTVYNYFYGHYLSPKYSDTKGTSFPDISVFAEKVDVSHQFNHQNENLNILADFPYPELKRKILEQYIELVIKKVESEIPLEMQPELIKQLQSAILMRFLGVRDLGKCEQKDVALSLALTGYFSDSTNANGKISDFLSTKFTSLRKIKA